MKDLLNLFNQQRPALDRARAMQWWTKWRWYTRPQRPWNRAMLHVEHEDGASLALNELAETRAELLDRLQTTVGALGTLTERLGIEFLSASPESVTARMPVAGNTQPYGLLHGGASAVLLAQHWQAWRVTSLSKLSLPMSQFGPSVRVEPPLPHKPRRLVAKPCAVRWLNSMEMRSPSRCAFSMAVAPTPRTLTKSCNNPTSTVP